MRRFLVLCCLVLALSSASVARAEDAISKLTEGSIWEGTIKRYVGGKFADSSDLKVKIINRKEKMFEAEWEMPAYGNKVLVKGKVISPNKISGLFAKTLAGNFPKDVIGNAKIGGTIQTEKKDEPTTIKGTYVVPGDERTAKWELKLVEE